MRGTQLTELITDPIRGAAEALDVVAGLDDALVQGLARVGAGRAAALAALAGAVAATPLGERVGEAVEKITAGLITDEYLLALAGGRTALLGAVHDSLLIRLDTVLGRTRAAWVQPPVPATPAPAPDNLLRGCRSWLNELAIAGWRGVDHDLVSTADQMIEALLAEPGLRRLAVLFDGFVAELRASFPIGALAELPVRRWADLWARAWLLSQVGNASPVLESAESVSGRLLILGVDVHEHGTALQVQVHGVLEPAGGAPPRLVRTSVAVAKVETIIGPALWRLLHAYPVLLGALAEHRSLDVTDLPLLASGDLVWRDDQASAGEPVDPFATARIQLVGALAPAVPPLDRHPVRIAEPVLVEEYTTIVDNDGTSVAFELDGRALTVDIDRLPACGPLTPALVAASSACIGLIRWDGDRWALQPLAVQTMVKRKTIVVHNGDWALGPTDSKVAKAEARVGDAVAVLRERAGRLLRR